MKLRKIGNETNNSQWLEQEQIITLDSKERSKIIVDKKIELCGYIQGVQFKNCYLGNYKRFEVV